MPLILRVIFSLAVLLVASLWAELTCYMDDNKRYLPLAKKSTKLIGVLLIITTIVAIMTL